MAEAPGRRESSGVPTEATSGGSGAGGSGDFRRQMALARRSVPASCLRARPAPSPSSPGQVQAVSKIMPTRPLGRQSWEWGSSWLAKISGHTLPVTAVAALPPPLSPPPPTPARRRAHNLHHVASVRPKIPGTVWMTRNAAVWWRAGDLEQDFIPPDLLEGGTGSAKPVPAFFLALALSPLNRSG